MVTFNDGPAAGKQVMLRSVPDFLRAVECDGQWDALDQPKDVPKPGETIYAYRRVGDVRQVHLRSSKPGSSGYYAMAEYALVSEQPLERTMRDRSAWETWCRIRKGVEVSNG